MNHHRITGVDHIGAKCSGVNWAMDHWITWHMISSCVSALHSMLELFLTRDIVSEKLCDFGGDHRGADHFGLATREMLVIFSMLTPRVLPSVLNPA